MKSKSDRTPTPWTTSRPDFDSFVQSTDGETVHVVYIYTHDGDERIPILGANPRERAARIVHAVNSHAALVEALEEAIEWSESAQGRGVPQVAGQPGAWINKARAALALAKGSP